MTSFLSPLRAIRACASAFLALSAIALAMAQSPTITSQPAVVTAVSGTRANFSVAASGAAPLSYQWRRLGVPIAGATSASLTINTVRMADAGLVDVVVTNLNGATTSQAGRLDVVPASYGNTWRLDTTFAPRFEEPFGLMRVVATLPDGRCYAGGDFSSIGNEARSYLVRFLADGTVDPAFNPQIGGGSVQCLAVAADGGVFVGGYFNVVGDYPRIGIAKLTSNGEVDPAFSPTLLSGEVFSILTQPDGKVVVGGYALRVTSAPDFRSIVRLLANGAVDASFSAPAPDGGSATRIVRQSDGKLIAAGYFPSVSGSTSSALIRLTASGAFDNTFAIGSGPSSNVTSMLVQEDDRVLLGGFFTSFNGATRPYLMRLQANGAFDPSYDATATITGAVNSLSATASGKLFVLANSGLVRLECTGVRDTTFTSIGYLSNTSIAAQPDGGVAVVGGFHWAGGMTAEGAVKFSSTGVGVWGQPNPLWSHTGFIHAAEPVAGGKWLVAGDFTRVNGVERKYLARLNADGTLDAAFDPAAAITSEVRALAVQGDGRILALENSGGSSTLRRLESTGVLDPGFSVGSGFSPEAELVTIAANGTILVGGNFSEVAGASRPNLARLTANGAVDSTFAAVSGLTWPSVLKPLTDGRLLVGGGFSGGVKRLSAAGVPEVSYPAGTGFSGGVDDVLDRPDGSLIVAGPAFSFSGVGVYGVVRLNPTGAMDPTFLPVLSGARTLRPQADGRILVVGEFRTAFGAPRDWIVRLEANGAPDPSFAAYDLAYAGRRARFADDGRILLVRARGARGGVEVNGLVALKSAPAPMAAITTAPVAQAAGQGGTAVFTVTATGDNLTYQWMKNGVDLAGATAATLVISNVQTGDLANYSVRVSNSYGSATSAPVALVAASPVITTQPGVTVGRSGNSVTLSVGASGSGTLTYQWSRLGVAIPGATSATLTLTNLTVANQGRYDVSVSNGFTSVSANPGWVIFQTSPATLRTDSVNARSLRQQTTLRQVTRGAVKVAAGSQGTFVLHGGMLSGTGLNSSGQLGDGTTTARSQLSYLFGGVANVAGGNRFTLFLKTDGSLWAAGENTSGQLGDGTTTMRLSPVQTATGVIAMAAGGAHSAFITTDRRLWTVGANTDGQLGDSGSTPRSTPVQISTGVRSVAAGKAHTLFLRTDGTLWATGDNIAGQLGTGMTPDLHLAEQVAENVAAITAGDYSSYFIKTDGTLWAMGDNTAGQLGDGTTTKRTLPVAIDADVVAVCGYGLSAAYITADGTVWTMGNNSSGQLGDGTLVNRSTPVAITTGAVEVAGGLTHLVVRSADGTVSTVGGDTALQLGRNILLPELVSWQSGLVAAASTFNDVTTLAATALYRSNGFYAPSFTVPGVLSLANGPSSGRRQYLVSDRTLYLADSSGGTAAIGTDVVAHDISGTNLDVFIKADGTLWGRGYDYYSIDLGLGSAKQFATDVAQVSAAATHVLFVKRDRTLWAVGTMTYGFVEGQPVGQYRSTPVQVQTGIVRAVAGSSRNYYIKSDGSLWRRGAGWTAAAGPEVLMDTNVLTVASSGVYLKADGTVWMNPAGTPTQLASGGLDVCRDSGDRISFLQADGFGTTPVINTQPVGTTAQPGWSITLSVSATSTGLIEYQWYRDGVALAGQCARELRIPSFAATDVGAYHVVVKGGQGSVTSNIANVQTDVWPTFLQTPADQIVAVGDPVTFDGTLNSSTAVTYDWMKDAAFISGAHNPTYTIPAAAVSDEGVYKVQAITWPSGGALTEGAILTVVDSATQLGVDRFGDGAIDDEWSVPLASYLKFNGTEFREKNGRLCFLADTPTKPVDRVLLREGSLVLNQNWTVTVRLGLAPNTSFPDLISPTSDRKTGFALAVGSTKDSGNNFDIAYRLSTYSGTLAREIVATRDTAGARTTSVFPGQISDASVVVRLAYNAASGICSAQMLVTGQFVTVGSFVPKSQWSLADTDTLEIALRGFSSRLNILEGQVWADDFVVVSRGGPEITQHPDSVLASLGGNASFTVAATGSGLSYQWYRDGVAVAGATVPTLNLTNLQDADFGRYYALVTSGAISRASTVALLEKTVAPSIVAAPSGTTIAVGESTSLFVGAGGTATLTYQWYRGESGDTANPISGATLATYTTPALSTWQRYWVRVTNAYGAQDSGTVLVRVLGGTMTFADWMAQTNLPAAQRGPMATPANDGVTNLMKFFLGLLPMEDASSRVTGPYRVNPMGSPLAFGLEIRKNAYAQGISYRLEVSRDLVNWSVAPSAENPSSPEFDGSVYMFIYETSAPTEAKRFLRLAVSLNP